MASPAILKQMRTKYSEPGIEGDLDPSANIWRKGIVFTSSTPSAGIDTGYGISVAFKRVVSSLHPLVGFRELYGRVITIGTELVSRVVSTNQNLSDTPAIVCHGWRLLGTDGKSDAIEEGGRIATAFLTLELRPTGPESASSGERQPTLEELDSPGGTDSEGLVRAEPHRAAEVYKEFDFTDSTDDPVTVSFGETIVPGENGAFDFKPSIERAEVFARCYYATLFSFGEVKIPFTVLRREWFLADLRFVTVHVCFQR